MKKSYSKKIVILAICFILTAVLTAVLNKYRSSDLSKPTEKSNKSETVSVIQTNPEIQSQTVTVKDETTSRKGTETETESVSLQAEENETTVLNILNCPEIKGSYEPTAFEAKLFNAINEKRKENGLSALNWNDCLHTNAKIRADETLDSFSHTRPNGKKPSTVLSDRKLSFTLFGECIAKGTNENDEGVRLLLNGFLNDPGQSEVLFSGEYVYAATAVSLDEDGIVHAVVLLCNP